VKPFLMDTWKVVTDENSRRGALYNRNSSEGRDGRADGAVLLLPGTDPLPCSLVHSRATP
jgi:hypothetical protein